MNLNTVQMAEVADSFQGAWSHVVANYQGENKEKLLAFTIELLMEEKPYLLVTTEGIQHAMALVFGSPSRQDFVLTLAYTFFSRWGHSDEDYAGLVANLARGVTQSGVQLPSGVGRVSNEAYRAVAAPIAERLADFTDVKPLLEVNPWLMVLLLIQLFIRLPETTGKTKQTA